MRQSWEGLAFRIVRELLEKKDWGNLEENTEKVFSGTEVRARRKIFTDPPNCPVKCCSTGTPDFYQLRYLSPSLGSALIPISLLYKAGGLLLSVRGNPAVLVGRSPAGLLSIMAFKVRVSMWLEIGSESHFKKQKPSRPWQNVQSLLWTMQIGLKSHHVLAW